MERPGERFIGLWEWTGQGRGRQFRFRGRAAAAILNTNIALCATDTDYGLAQCALWLPVATIYNPVV